MHGEIKLLTRPLLPQAHACFFNKYGGNTESFFAILLSLIFQHYITHSFKYCDAKFAHRVYKQAYEYRLPSVVALNANCNRKRSARSVKEKSAFGVRNKSKALRAVLYSGTTFNSNSTSSSEQTKLPDFFPSEFGIL